MVRLPTIACVAVLAGPACARPHTATPVGAQPVRTAATSPYAIDVPPGYQIELVADHLDLPTGVAFGAQGEIYVVESGYPIGEAPGTPRLLELEPGGRQRELATGDHAPWLGVAYDRGSLYVAEGGEREGGRIVRYPAQGGEAEVLVDDLPSQGDHATSGPVIEGGWLYFGQGTATNAGVVGVDSFDAGWLRDQPQLHDTPCRDVTLTGINFESPNPLTSDDDRASTGAFLPFGTAGEQGQIVAGAVPCSGAVMRMPTGGGPVELVAWGFRSPSGLAFDGGGQLYVTDGGYDDRGSRPVFGAGDPLWKVEPGRWYGWPDFAEGRPLTLAAWSEGDGKPAGFVIADHPEAPPQPSAVLPVHGSADGLDVSRSDGFGHVGDAFVALFGDRSPADGGVRGPIGFSVVEVDPRTGAIATFARNRSGGPASMLPQRGLERPIAVRFDPAGDALYVVDFGMLRITDHGPRLRPRSGALWRISRSAP